MPKRAYKAPSSGSSVPVAAWLGVALCLFLIFGDTKGCSLPVIGGKALFKAPTEAPYLLMLEETDERRNLTKEQKDALDSAALNTWVQKDQHGDLRLLDVTERPKEEPQWVQDAYDVATKTPGFKTPWIIGSNNHRSINEPLPATEADTLAAVKPLGK